MIRCVVYLLRIFKLFHGLMNNPVYCYFLLPPDDGQLVVVVVVVIVVVVVVEVLRDCLDSW
jgi:hypothetical protein